MTYNFLTNNQVLKRNDLFTENPKLSEREMPTVKLNDEVIILRQPESSVI